MVSARQTLGLLLLDTHILFVETTSLNDVITIQLVGAVDHRLRVPVRVAYVVHSVLLAEQGSDRSAWVKSVNWLTGSHKHIYVALTIVSQKNFKTLGFRINVYVLSFPNIIDDDAVVIAAWYRVLAVLAEVQTIDCVCVWISSGDPKTSQEAVGDSHCCTDDVLTETCDLAFIDTACCDLLDERPTSFKIHGSDGHSLEEQRYNASRKIILPARDNPNPIV